MQKKEKPSRNVQRFASGGANPKLVAATVPLLLLLVGGILLFLRYTHSAYYSFRHQSQNYYLAYGTACEDLLGMYPLGTNDWIEVSTTDKMLPVAIRKLNPETIKIAPNWVWISLGYSPRFGITWERQGDSLTNAWTLKTTCESGASIVFNKQ